MAGFFLSQVVMALLAQDPGPASVEFESVSGHPGEVVRVPVLATFGHPMRAMYVFFKYDEARLELVKFDTEGSDVADVDPLALVYRTYRDGQGLLGFDPRREDTRLYRVAPGVGRHMGYLHMRIRASAGEGEATLEPVLKTTATAGSTEFDLYVNDIGDSVTPDILGGSKVTVLPPLGPRPVGDLGCVQFLDRIQLFFTPAEACDGIEISRDGALIATLPGDASAFTDPLQGTGGVTYSVVARRGAEASIAATCEVLASAPAAPAVQGLACGESGLTWTNPVLYDRVVVLRDGQTIADLPGDTQRFSDPERPDFMVLYTVIGELEGFRSPDVNCVDNGIWIMEIGDVQVPVGAEKVIVPIFLTSSKTVRGLDCVISMDIITEHGFRLVEDDMDGNLEGTAASHDPEFFATGIGAYNAPVVAVIYDLHNPKQPEKDLQCGLRQRALNFVLAPERPHEDGDVVPVTIIIGSCTVDTEAGAQSAHIDSYLPGQIRFGSGGPAGVRNLAAAVDGAGGGGAADGGGASAQDVLLSWENGEAYEKIVLERNGTPLAEVGGDARTYRDGGVPSGVYTYKVSGISGGKTTFPASAFLTTVSGRGIFLRGDANGDRKINIADPVATLNFLFRGRSALACEDGADTDDSGSLGLTDAVLTLLYLFRGEGVIRAPGARYAWFDPTPDVLTCGK